jgi:hypothetical protein
LSDWPTMDHAVSIKFDGEGPVMLFALEMITNSSGDPSTIDLTLRSYVKMNALSKDLQSQIRGELAIKGAHQ